MLDSLFKDFDNIIVLDTETTGFDPRREEIIELAMLCLTNKGGSPEIALEYDSFISLSPGKKLPPKIVELTGITDELLLQEGQEKAKVCAELAQTLSPKRSLVVAYNAQFDLCFLYYFLAAFGKAGVLKNIKMLDALTIYKDRRPYPHKLSDAVSAYALQSQNTHRAIDDTYATYELLCAMDAECPDLDRYINLFGFNPRFGVSGSRISSVRYLPQGYDASGKLYEQT